MFFILIFGVNVNYDFKRKVFFFFFGLCVLILIWWNGVIVFFLYKFYYIFIGMKEEIYYIGYIEVFIFLLFLKDNVIIFILIIWVFVVSIV